VKSVFDIIDHTADVGIIAYGADFKQLFSNAALALVSLITDAQNIEERLEHYVEINSESRDDLLVGWLNELVYLFDAEHLLFNRFDVESLDNNQLKATCYGEKFNPSKHRIKMGIKAATYYMLEVTGDSRGYRAQVIFDV
jgi:SHS2 domain-containing protein